MKENIKNTIVGYIILFLGTLSFVDVVHPLSIGIYHLRPYFIPVSLLILGWDFIHGRHLPLRKKIHHHSHVAFLISILIFILTIYLVSVK